MRHSTLLVEGFACGPLVQRNTCLGIVRNHSRVHGAFGARSVCAKVLTRAQQTLCPNNTPKLYPPPELRPEAPPACLPLCVSCHRWRVPSAKLGLELLHDQEDDHHSRHDAAKVRPETIVQRHGALGRGGLG